MITRITQKQIEKMLKVKNIKESDVKICNCKDIEKHHSTNIKKG